MDKILFALDDYESWSFDWGNKNHAFNVKNPNFTMTTDDEYNDGWEPLASFYLASDFHFKKLIICYNSAVIHETEIWALDGYRKFLPKPSIGHSYDKNDQIFFYYYLLDSIDGKLFKAFTQGKMLLSSREQNDDIILIFKNHSELCDFIDFFETAVEQIDKEYISKKYQYQIATEIKENGGCRVFSAGHVALSSYIFKLWKNRN